MSGRSRWVRLALFAASFLGVLLWIQSCGEGEEALARSFLRNLARTLF